MEEERIREEPRLLHRSRFDEDALRTSYRQLMKPMKVIQLVLAAWVLVLAVWYTVRCCSMSEKDRATLVLVVLLFVFAGLTVWRALTGADRAAKRAVRRLQETKKRDTYSVVLRFCEEEFTAESDMGGAAQHLPYSEIRKLTRGRELIVLRTLTPMVHTLDPAGFENGTEADFWKLMNEKCPQAVPKQYRQG